MGHDNNGYDKHDLVYASSESRPDNAPALVGAGTEIQIISENDSPDWGEGVYRVSDFVKSWPATSTWGLWIEDADGNAIKDLFALKTGAPGENDAVLFDVENDYVDAKTAGNVGGTLTDPPVIASFDAFLVSTEEGDGKVNMVPLRMVGHCYEGLVSAQDRATDEVAEPAATAYPLEVSAGEFFTDDGGFTWECSLDGATWGLVVNIPAQPALTGVPNGIDVFLRASLPCPATPLTKVFYFVDGPE